jgi:hypothetical protein
MQLVEHGHASEEFLEQYALGLLTGSPLAQLEEHLLICSRCQEQLKETDDYVAAMRGAAVRLHHEDESRKRSWTVISGALTFRRLGWGMAVAALALAGLALRFGPKPAQSSQPFALALQTSRGSELLHAPARRPLDLSLDVTALPPFSAYQVETVDAMGRVETQSSAEASGGRVRTSVAKGLLSGNYFIRLYSPSRELLREFSLRIE